MSFSCIDFFLAIDDSFLKSDLSIGILLSRWGLNDNLSFEYNSRYLYLSEFYYCFYRFTLMVKLSFVGNP